MGGQSYEILAPAGGREAFFAAVHAGANAVYLGLADFSARKNAENFTADTVKYYIDYAHVLGVRVFVALNTLFSDAETPAFLAAAAAADAAGADALIVQDLLWGKRLAALFPRLELHLSTQAGVCSAAHARLAHQYGFCRVVAARETPLETLAEMAKFITVEAFVQGALCSAFSGQCYLSSFIGKNSGNRGLCKQPCRKKYALAAGGAGIGAGAANPARRLTAAFDYALSTSDLCVSKRIFELIGAGISSFKIEGRMRRSEYVAASVGYFRALLSGAPAAALTPRLSDLKRAYNRGDYTEGFAFSERPANFLCTEVQGNIGEKIGVVTRLCGGGVAQTDARFAGRAGDAVKILRGKTEVGNGVFCTEKDAGNAADIKNGAKIKFIGGVLPGDEVRLTTDTALSERLLAARRSVACVVFVEIFAGKIISARAEADGVCVFAASDTAAERARTAALGAEAVVKCFSKVDEYPFAPEIKVMTDGEAFAAVSSLNSVRRELYKKLFDALAEKRRGGQKQIEQPEDAEAASTIQTTGMGAGSAHVAVKDGCGKISAAKTFIIADDFSSLTLLPDDAAVFAPADYGDETAFARFFTEQGMKTCAARLLYLPPFLTDAMQTGVRHLLEKYPLFDGVYAQSLGALELARSIGLPLVLGEGGNIYNSHAFLEARQLEGICGVCLSKELSCAQRSALLESAEAEATGTDKHAAALTFYAGGICVMTLAHCPNKWQCGKCKKPRAFTLTDEGGKEFYLRRVDLFGKCVFELYNCAVLVPAPHKNPDGETGVKNVVCLMAFDKAFASKFLEGIRNKKSASEIFDGAGNVYTFGYK